MNKQSVIIYNFDILFNILNEVKENLKFNLIKLKKACCSLLSLVLHTFTEKLD